MRPYQGKRVLLGVTGGIASYKSVWLARLLSQAGAEVDVVMTPAALEFVGAITFEAVTGRRVCTEIFGSGNSLDHIKLAQAANIVIVAPATADFLARAVHGHANDLLTACLLATSAPVLLAPAMNDKMWAHRQTRDNVIHAEEIGYEIIEPEKGPLAFGEGNGIGRMPEPETLMAHVGRVLSGKNSPLYARSVVVTAGGTREDIDPVRFISNRSTGKMGVALAEAAWMRGADVTLIAGHIEVPPPAGVSFVQVESVSEMADEISEVIGEASVMIMAAAPADFVASAPATSKIKRTGGPLELSLAPAVDILKTMERPDDLITVGFALETDDAIKNGEAKLYDKSLDMIVVNNASEPGAGFAVDTNRVTMIDKKGKREDLALMPKREVAEVILDRVEALLPKKKSRSLARAGNDD